MDNKKKKLLFILIPAVLVLVIAAVVTVILLNAKGKPDPITVTDENGVVLTDTDGNPITVVPETEVVEVTDSDGNPVLDENGKPLTTVIYKDTFVTVPKTDENGNTVYETIVVRPEASYAPGEVIGSSAVPMTDGQGNTGLDSEGNVLTTIIDITAPPVLDIEPASIDWKFTRGGTLSDTVTDLILTSDGCYITSCVTNSVDGDFKQFEKSGFTTPYTVLTKTDKNGKIVWEKGIGFADGIFRINALASGSDGSFYAAGYGDCFDGTDGYGYYDAFVAKFSKDGKMLWVKKFGTSTVDLFKDITVTSDGGIVAVGSVGNNDFDADGSGGKRLQSRAVAAKFSESGDLVWKKFFGGNMDTFNGIAEGSDGSLYIVGTFFSDELFEVLGEAAGDGSKQSDAGVLKLTKDGKLLKTVPVSGTKSESFNGIITTSDGSVVIVGRSNSYDVSNNSSFFTGDLAARGDYDAYIIRFDSSLSFIAASAFRGQNAERFEDLIETEEGTLIAVGYTNSSTRDLKGVTTRGGDDIVIAAFNKSCSLLWARSFGGTADDSAAAVVRGVNGGYVVAGTSASTDVDLKGISDYAGNNSVGVIVKFPD